MSRIEKGSPEWFEAKRKARADLDTRMALGLPHSSQPIPEVKGKAPVAPVETGALKQTRAPRKRAPKKAE